MYNIKCLNPISPLGMELFSDNYQVIDDAALRHAILVRSASMHDMELGENLDAIARAGAGV